MMQILVQMTGKSSKQMYTQAHRYSQRRNIYVVRLHTLKLHSTLW
jgi:hypothetical protein